jgi:hypothetical protein
MRPAAGDFDTERMLVRVEELVEKRDFSDKEREHLAGTGAAMPDGSYPIKTVQDLRNAIHAIGRAKDPAAVKAHIRRRAQALGRTDLIPDSWKAAAPGMWVHDPQQIAAVRDGLVNLMRAELDELADGENEMADLSNLLNALCLLMAWWDHEAAEGETSDPYPAGDNGGPAVATTIGLASEPAVEKTAGAEAPAPAEQPEAAGTAPPAEKAAEADPKPDLAELVKAAVAQAVAPLEAQLAKAMEQPAPGGPVLARPGVDITKADARAAALGKAANYERLAYEVSDPQARAGYLQLAAEARASATS